MDRKGGLTYLIQGKFIANNYSMSARWIRDGGSDYSALS